MSVCGLHMSASPLSFSLHLSCPTSISLPATPPPASLVLCSLCSPRAMGVAACACLRCGPAAARASAPPEPGARGTFASLHGRLHHVSTAAHRAPAGARNSRALRLPPRAPPPCRSPAPLRWRRQGRQEWVGTS